MMNPHPLTGTHIRLEPVTPARHDELRDALDCDRENWAIQVASAQGKHWGAWWEALVRGQETLAQGDGAAGQRRVAWAVRDVASGGLAGTSSFLFVDERHGTCEIGATWFRPEFRGGVVNVEAKLLMLGAAFGAGIERVAFRVDERNGRSQAALLKLGAVREGVARGDFLTWTGHRRSSVVFSVLRDEWPRVRAGLEARLADYG